MVDIENWIVVGGDDAGDVLLVEAEVRLDEAEIDLRRTQELVRAGVTTEADLDTAKAEVARRALDAGRSRPGDGTKPGRSDLWFRSRFL